MAVLADDIQYCLYLPSQLQLERNYLYVSSIIYLLDSLSVASTKQTGILCPDKKKKR